jgi:hypothetical protein
MNVEREIAAAFAAVQADRADTLESEIGATLTATRTLAAELDTDSAWELHYALLETRTTARETVVRLFA